MNTLKNDLKRDFSQVPNDLITDLTLSHGALRVILYLFTKPDTWNVYNKDIQKQLNISDKTLSKYWKELLESKWLRRTKNLPTDENNAGGYSYQIGRFVISEESYEKEESYSHSNNKPSKKQVTNKEKKLLNDFKESFNKDIKVTDETLLDFIRYRKELKKEIKTARPLVIYINTLIDCMKSGYSKESVIDLMKDKEWQSLKLEWVKNELPLKDGRKGWTS